MSGVDELDAAISQTVNSASPAPTSVAAAPKSDPLDTAIDSVGSANTQQLRQSMYGAIRTNPDDYAKAKQLEQSTGVPAEISARNLQSVEQISKLNDATKLIDSSPILASHLQDPGFAKLAHDDTKTLQTWEQFVSQPGVRDKLSIAGVGKELAGLPYAALSGLGSSFNEAGIALSTVVGVAPYTYDKFTGDPNQTAWGWWYRNMLQGAEANRTAFQGDANGNPNGFIGKAANTAGQMVGMLSQIGLTGGLGGSGALAEAGQIADTAGQAVVNQIQHGARAMAFPAASEAVNTGRSVYQETGDPNQAARAAGMAYLTTTLGGVVPITAPGNVGQRLLGGFASGAVTSEASRQAMNTVLPPSMQTPASAENIILGGVAGSILAAGGPRADPGNLHSAVRQSYDDAIKNETAIQDYQLLTKLSEVAQESKLAKRDPESFKQFLQATTEDGRIESLYIDKAKLTEVLQQSPKELQQLAHQLPDVAKQLDDPTTVGGLIHIPTADFATHVAGTPVGDALLPHLRVDPEGKTYAEAQAHLADESLTLSEKAKQISEEKQSDTEWQASAQRVHDDLFRQLEETKRFPSDVNKANAALVRDFYATQANAMGLMPHEMYERYPLRVQSEAAGTGNERVLNQSPAVPRETSQPVERTIAVPGFGSIKINQAYDVGLAGGSAKDSNTVYADRSINLVKTINGKSYDFGIPLAIHELVERKFERAGESYTDAHNKAEHAENEWVKNNWELSPQEYEHAWKGDIQMAAQKAEKGGSPPPDIVDKPYDHPHSVRARDMLAEVKTGEASSPQTVTLGKGPVVSLWSDISKRDDAFQTPTTKATDLDQALTDVVPELGADIERVENLKTAKGEAAPGYAVSIEGKNGNRILAMRVYEADSDRPFIEIGHEAADIGTGVGKLYQAVAGWALNNGKTLRPDPRGLTPINELRRTEQMVSSMLKYGESKMWEPDISQFVGLLDDGAYHAWQEQGKESPSLTDKLQNLKDKYWGSANGENADYDVTQARINNMAIAGTTLAARRAPGEFNALADSQGNIRVRDEAGGTQTLDRDAGYRAAMASGSAHVGVGYSTRKRALLTAQAFGWNSEKGVGQLHQLGAESLQSFDAAGHPDLHPRADVQYPGQARVASSDALSRSLYQGGDAARGSINFGDDITKTPSVIALLKDADLSTFLHESGHFFLEVMHDVASKADAPDRIGNDFQTVLQSFGLKGTPEENLKQWRAMSLDEKRPLHEQFARSFEQYLMEGKAPSQAQAGLFGRFRSWLLNVYQSLSNLSVSLSPEVRGVFDRLLASEDAIKHAETVRGYETLFKTPEDAAKLGMSADDYAKYKAQGQEATDAAINAMDQKTLKDMKWLSNAKNKALRGLQREAATQRKAIRSEVEKEANQQPIYRAEDYLRKGILRDADGKETKLDRKAAKLDPEAIARIAPEIDLGKLNGMTSASGEHPDAVAERFGLNSGADLVRQLADRLPREDVVRQLTDQRMLERHGELTDRQSVERAAEEAIHNEARAKFLATGLKVLTKSSVSARELAKTAQDVAQHTIDGKTIKDLRPLQYSASEARANRSALKLVAKDPQAAQEAQRTALLNNRLAKTAADAVEYVNKNRDYLKRFDKESIRKAMPGDFLEQIDNILGQFNLRQNPSDPFTRPKQNLIDWASGLRELGFEPQIAEWLAEYPKQTHYKELTVEQFRGLVDTVRSIEHTAKETKAVTVAGKRMALDEVVKNLTDRLAERGEKFTKEQLIEEPTAKVDGLWASATHWISTHLRLSDADLKPQDFRSNKYDMHDIQGPFREALFDRMFDRNYWKVDMTKRVSDAAEKVGKALGKDWQKSLYDLVKNDRLMDPDLSTPDSPTMMKMTRGRMLGIARHVGNESNFDKLVKGYGWKPEDVWRFLHDNMTANDWKATQAHWDSFEPLWTETSAMVKRLAGSAPEKIPAREFDTKFGKQRGGYSPIDYDPMRSKLASSKGEFDLSSTDKVADNAKPYRATTTSNGSLMNRKEGYTDRVGLDFHSAEIRMRDTIHDLAYRESLLDASKIVNDKTFRDKFMLTYGKEEYQALTDWLRDIRDMHTTDPRNRNFEKAMQYTRQGVVMTGIAYRISTVLKHGSSAALKSLGYLGNSDGAKYFAARVARMASGHLLEDIQGAQEKFPEIRARMLQMDRDYKQGNASMYESEGWRAKNDRFGHMMVAWSDALSAVPTAWAAYDLAKTKGVQVSMGGSGKPMAEEAAIRYANSVVRQAHGSALETARSNFMQAKGMKGLFGTIYGFMNNTYGQLGDMLDKSVSGGHFNNKPAIAARALATLVVPAMIAAWIKNGGPSKDESKTGWAAKALAGEVAGTVPFVRDAASLLEYGRGGTVAPMQVITDAVNSGRDIYKEMNGHDSRLIKDLSNAIGEWAHIGGFGQAGHILQYMHDVNTGKKNPENTAQAVKEAVIGGRS